MIDAVAARLTSQVAALEGRVDKAARLAEMQRTNRMPQRTPAAFVIPNGMTGGEERTASGQFRQQITEVVAVVLMVRGNDRAGEKALEAIDGLIKTVIAAVAGWAPDGVVGVFRLARGATISWVEGTFIYQLDFTITDQLRISP